MSKKRYAFLYTWPNNSFKNAEYECLKRVEIAAKNNNIPIDIISKNGYLLDNEYFETKQRVKESDYEFMVSVHYDDIKFLDIFMYYTLWVPPEIAMRYDCYNQIKKNILFNDDYIVHDLGGMSGHLKTLLWDTGRSLDGASSLTAAPPASCAQEPRLDDPYLFYCGINWEKLIGEQKRHAGLFDLLEEYPHIKIYGPESTWTGSKRYCGTIPFDGVSIINEINKAGIVLALSSDAHYRAGSATNRIYEGCAGGAVIISDTNPYIINKFGDSVLYFDFDKRNPNKMYNQIIDHVDWVRKHREEAKKIAKKSQEIFLKDHAMERQLRRLIENHERRKQYVSSVLLSKDKKAVVLTLLIIDSFKIDADDVKLIENTIYNINNQIEKNINLVIACDEKNKDNIYKIVNNTILNGTSVNICPFAIYDEFENKWKTKGQIFTEVCKKYTHSYVMMLSGNEGMFKDHISSLKRVLEDDENAAIAYCGSLAETSDGEFNNYQFEIIKKTKIYDGEFFTSFGQFLMKSKVEQYLPDYVFDNIDGGEVIALVNMAVFKYNDKFVFSKRMTNRTKLYLRVKDNSIIDIHWQLNLIHGLFIWEYEKWKAYTYTQHEDFIASIGQTLAGRKLLKLLYKYLKVNIFVKKVIRVFNRSNKIKKRINEEKSVINTIYKYTRG